MAVNTVKCSVLLSVLLLVVLGVHSQSVDLERDARLTTTELLRAYNYPAEEHRVITEDGYILEMHRVPNPGRPAVLVMHGMLSSSADFVLMGPGIALAYFLHDEGYDVWMGNCRGNRYSTAHVSLSPESDTFWRFSWDEIGQFDLPAMIDYVIDATGQPQIQYIGHSQGTTTFWVMCHHRPDYNSKISAMHAMAGAAWMHNTLSPFTRWLATWLTTVEMALEYLGEMYFAPTDEAQIQGGFDDCQDGAPDQRMCANIIFLIAGYNPAEMNMVRDFDAFVLVRRIEFVLFSSSPDHVAIDQCTLPGWSIIAANDPLWTSDPIDAFPQI